MSVDKYRIVKESSNYTIIPNKILQNLNNYEALGLYSYLVSLPDNWEFHKNHLSKRAKIGRDKLNNLIKLLKKCNLIDFNQERNEKGQYTEWHLHVKNGENFIPIPDAEDSVEPFTEKPLTANQLLANSTYKRNNKKEIKDKKEIEREDLKKTNPEKKKEIACPEDIEQLITPNAEKFASEKKLDARQIARRMIFWSKSKGIKKTDWTAELILWILREDETKEDKVVNFNKNSDKTTDYINTRSNSHVTNEDSIARDRVHWEKQKLVMIQNN